MQTSVVAVLVYQSTHAIKFRSNDVLYGAVD